MQPADPADLTAALATVRELTADPQRAMTDDEWRSLNIASRGIARELVRLAAANRVLDGYLNKNCEQYRTAAHRLASAFLAAPTPLAWTDAKPTVPGWYWRRDDINQEPCIGYYDPKNWFGTEWMRDLPGQFAGPIPPPAPTPTEDAPR